MDQADISAKNSSFWDELCGSGLAKYLGITDDSPQSLKKFDDWYFDFYPYLSEHIQFDKLAGKNVLEVGLGYGTVSQRLAASGAIYTGLDIALGPVAMVNHRLKQNDFDGLALQGSILEPPVSRESFDHIVAIGCLHHTGNLKLAIDQCWSLLKPGGTLIFMVYYAYSYRRFNMALPSTLRYMLSELLGKRGVVGSSAEQERAAYDAGTAGHAAPHTDWISARSLGCLCEKYSSFSYKIENIDQDFPLSKKTRKILLGSKWPSRVGLDLYAMATK